MDGRQEVDPRFQFEYPAIVMAARKRLMLVDDDKNSREGYQIYLAAKGFRVHAFEGGADALAFAASESPDLVVLDLGLPDVDGWEVARRLKGDENTKDIPIIAFSGRSLHHEQVSALRAGCDVHLTKPCPPDRLLGAIQKLLGLETHGMRAEASTDPY